MARQVLAGPGDEGRASYQVSLTVCSACGRGDQLGGGELVPVGDEVVAMAECDGQHIGQLLPRADIEPGASDPAAAAPANDVHVGVTGSCRREPRRRIGRRRRDSCRCACASDRSRQTEYPARGASCRARARSTPLSRSGMHPRHVPRHSPRRSALRGRQQRPQKHHHHLWSAPPRDSSRRAHHRAGPRWVTEVPARGRQHLRPRRVAAGRRRAGQGLRRPAPPGLSRAGRQGCPRRAPRR